MNASGDGKRFETPPRSQTTIVLRPIGSGLPLGFFSFGIGMLILGCQAIGWIPVGEQHDGGMILMAFVFPLELVATIFAFLARDTLGATTLGLFTTSWLTLGWTQLASPPGQTSVTVGIYLFGFATAVLLLATLSTLGKPFFSVLLSLAASRMILSGLYEVGAAGKVVFEVSGASRSRSPRSRCTAVPHSGSRTLTSGKCCRCSGAAPPQSPSRASTGSSSGSKPRRESGSSFNEAQPVLNAEGVIALGMLARWVRLRA